MDKFLKLIGWKRYSGRWDTTEIVFDFTVVSLVIAAIFIATK